MTWTVEWDERARRELRRLDKATQTVILNYFSKRIETNSNPRRFGKPLKHQFKGLWRYRIGDYRAVCQIQNNKLVVLVLAIGHRRNIYR